VNRAGQIPPATRHPDATLPTRHRRPDNAGATPPAAMAMYTSCRVGGHPGFALDGEIEPGGGTCSIDWQTMRRRLRSPDLDGLPRREATRRSSSCRAPPRALARPGGRVRVVCAAGESGPFGRERIDRAVAVDGSLRKAIADDGGDVP
jgi:hypothetical protein